MKAKLFKEDQIYYLSIDNKLIGSTYFKLPKGITYKLSLKNCQAIECGYDLDELVSSEGYTAELFGEEGYLIRQAAFRNGFKKALEILGDKKFSEDDVKLAINLAWDEDNMTTIDIIQELQQNEWEVEIDMEFKPINHASGLEFTGNEFMDFAISQNYKPKLDSEGNLILKKI